MNTFKKFTTIVCFALMSGVAPQVFAVEYEASLDVKDGYVFGYGSRELKGTTPEINLSASFDNGFYVNLWSVLDNVELHEVDYTAGYVWEPADKWSVDMSLNWWNVKPLNQSPGDVLVPIIRIERELSDSTYAYVTVDSYHVRNDHASNGVNGYGGMGTSFDIGAVTVGLEGEVGYQEGYEASQWFSKVSIQPEMQLGEQTTLRLPGITAWFPDGEDMEYTVTFVGVTHTF